MSSWFVGIFAAAISAGGVAILLILRAQRARIVAGLGAVDLPAASGILAFLQARLAELGGQMRYLATPRESRYAVPWVMLLGEQGAGKSSLASSFAALHPQPPGKCAGFSAPGTQWRCINGGVLIDPIGKLPAGATDSAEGSAWADTLTAIGDLRPERALDGVLIAVSARTLLCEPADKQQAVAENVRRQIEYLQERIEFALPVYVVVTKCDVVAGFAAFWRSLSPKHRKEMFGWSAPAVDQVSGPSDWAESTFDTLVARLKALQIRASAREGGIDQADDFFLFPRHLQLLQAPLGKWLDTVFQPSAWQPASFFRGLYFAGSIAATGANPPAVADPRSDIAFIDDLIGKKIFGENGLARPVHQGVWSRNRIIRRMQIGVVAVSVILFAALLAASIKLKTQIDTLAQSMDEAEKWAIRVAPAQNCIAQDEMFTMLSRIAQMDAGTGYFPNPVSWVYSPVSDAGAKRIAEHVVNPTILPQLACLLNKRAAQLQAASIPDAALKPPVVEKSHDALFAYVRDVQTYEENLARFQQLSFRSSHVDRSRAVQTLDELVQYLYGNPLPAEARQDRGLLGKALAQASYSKDLPDLTGLRDRLTGNMLTLSNNLGASVGREIQNGPTALAKLTGEQEPILENTRYFAWWLNWVRKSWLGSSEDGNLCEQYRKEYSGSASILINRYQYPTRLISGADPFAKNNCYQPAMETIKGLQLAPYGKIFEPKAGVLDLNPKLAGEVSGLTALVELPYMQVDQTPAFICREPGTGWVATETAKASAYARQYLNFAQAQGLPPLGSAKAERPLYDRLALHSLESAMNASMLAAQASYQPSVPPEAVDAISAEEQQLARRSSDFAGVAPPLVDVLRMYKQFGFDLSGSRISECARNYASDTLAQIQSFAVKSRVYAVDANYVDGPLFALGAAPATKDYLARQLARVQVLSGYANPYVVFLQNGKAVNDAQRDSTETEVYWSATIAELNRYVQFKDPAGQAALLDNLFMKQLSGLTYANCAKTLAAYQSPDIGNDLFSSRRALIEEQAGQLCEDRTTALAKQTYGALAMRFNNELSRRYPFGDLNAPNMVEAAPAKVKSFFADYANQREALQAALAGNGDASWKAARQFLAQLDAVNDFLGATLVAGDRGRPVKLDTTFHARPTLSQGSEQIVNWTLTAGSNATAYPNRLRTLDWPFGEALVLDLDWADRSIWRPGGDAKASDMSVDGTIASFAASGNWALMKMIDRHRPKAGSQSDPLDPNRILLEFNVRIFNFTADSGKAPGAVRWSQARAYIGLNLSTQDPKTQAVEPLKYPAVFPQVAPVLN